MKPYELVVILHPDLEIDIDASVAKLEKLVKQAGGSIASQDNWGKKRLAYPIKKHNFGLYLFYELQLPPTGVRELESQLLITEEVIRFLMVTKPKPPKPKKQKTKPAAEAKE